MLLKRMMYFDDKLGIPKDFYDEVKADANEIANMLVFKAKNMGNYSLMMAIAVCFGWYKLHLDYVNRLFAEYIEHGWKWFKAWIDDDRSREEVIRDIKKNKENGIVILVIAALVQESEIMVVGVCDGELRKVRINGLSL